ncbi:Putative nucleoporin Nup54/Nup57/Nup44, nucleoporin Nup54, alpha-helical domain-containing protein [Septoria linicola]|uniref:Nucleoporin Nup54/Nup57/Nup44, nucleoporin Nup54, alpha-helical domain-containing protein n=1 Tax=Septoria linicola TaxID=215465 RepID=A0A9Q9APF2_9PEZI|nr:Putative nucleoporin Nup54/Nup57/Nup44, nucleoporin Nup54, alpha-helical domain-containing protein [Septoria linicola]
MSLFGGGGLFGSTANNTATTTGNTGGGGLFGSNAAASTNTAGRGLFGNTTNNTNQSTGGGLFGNANTTQNQTSNTGGGLFGSTTANNNTNAGTSSLFGGGNTTTNHTSSLFGGGATQNQQQNNNNNNNNTSSLFASTGGGLFGANTNQQPQNASSAFGQNQPQQQQQQAPLSNASMFNPQTVSVGGLGHTMTNAQLQRLQFSGAVTTPNEKKISDQIETVANKWDPNQREDPNSNTNPRRTTVLQTYLYNAVPKEYAPFFYPDFNRGEDEKSWEEALSQKPELPKVDGKEVSGLAYVPILVVGFKALGDRVETQAKIVQEMRSRLHEMNNSLTAVMDAHQQRITVKIAAAKHQHQVLSQRCLRLAVKVQVLRNRGYALDAQEEGLRKTLLSLERQVTDPSFIGREDEIWARMVALRERARWLEEEGRRVAAQVDSQNQQGQNAATSTGIPEDVLAKTRKILKDYDGQLQHLNKELEEVKKEYAAWEEIKGRR